MNKKNVIILIIGIIIFCLALVFFIFSINSKKENSQNNIEVEEVSKTKDLEDVDYTDFVFYREDRSEVRLSNYKDKPAMILFWNEDTEDISREKVSDEIKNSISMEIYYDLYKEGVLKYNISEFPSMIYIAEDNSIMNAKAGLTTRDALEANLDILSNNI